MKRKFFISLILTVFFLSSTGMPQVIHQCNLTGEKSLDFCAACSEEEHKKPDSCCETQPVKEPSCCEEETPAGTTSNDESCVIVKASEQTCCSDHISLLKINDDFSVSAAKKFIEAGALIVATLDIPELNSDHTARIIHFQDIPPPLFGKNLLYSLHQLKIAAPLS